MNQPNPVVSGWLKIGNPCFDAKTGKCCKKIYCQHKQLFHVKVKRPHRYYGGTSEGSTDCNPYHYINTYFVESDAIYYQNSGTYPQDKLNENYIFMIKIVIQFQLPI